MTSENPDQMRQPRDEAEACFAWAVQAVYRQWSNDAINDAHKGKIEQKELDAVVFMKTRFARYFDIDSGFDSF